MSMGSPVFSVCLTVQNGVKHCREGFPCDAEVSLGCTVVVVELYHDWILGELSYNSSTATGAIEDR